MKHRFLLLIVAICFAGISMDGWAQLPKLEQNANAKQLMVDGKPFIMLGGELGNSTASSPYYMEGTWQKLADLNLNTVLVPVYWELIEPTEGEFDFTTLDYALNSAREHNLKLVLLWFGTWKNSMSCYVPLWTKQQFGKRFPLAKTKSRKSLEIMSAFSDSNLEADKKAFVAMMNHLKEHDKQHTVIMVQVENEIGMLENARDWSNIANKKFAEQVPSDLMKYLKRNKKELHPTLLKQWSDAGFNSQGSWEEVFGKGLETDEIFMAYHYALYTEQITAAGRKVLDLPMYVNAALNSRGRVAGEYPSAGPLAHLSDIWKFAAPSIDIMAPDIYDPGFPMWCEQYDFKDNPLFIPEIRMAPENGARVFYALGKHKAIGFSPFSIEDTDDQHLSSAYELLGAFHDLIAQKQAEGKVYGVLFDVENQEQTITINDIRFICKHDLTLGWNPLAKDSSKWSETAALIIDMDNDSYLVLGTGVVITFENIDPKGEFVGIGEIDELIVRDGEMVMSRRMSGDQNHQGRHLRIPFGNYEAQTLKTYKYR